MLAAAVPQPIGRLLGFTALDYLARLALALPFLVSGLVKLFEFGGATEEVAGLGLRPGAQFAAAVILTQLGGSALFMTRRFCWLGAGILAGFTVLAALLAHSFWTFEGDDLGRQTATFLEHLAIVGGFAIAAIFLNGRRAST